MAHPGRHFFSYRLLAAILIPVLAAGGVFAAQRAGWLANPAAQPIPVESGSASRTGGFTGMTDDPTPIPVQLSEGRPQPQVSPTARPVDTEDLTAAERAAILARLPALPEDAAEQVDFKLPQDPIPPPRTGQTVSQSFPPDAAARQQPTAEPAGPLEVLRYSPEGEIPLAPFISVTFNQPMVALAALEDLAAAAVPARIEPNLPGTWRWVGAKTLTFEYDSGEIDRLPKATAYRVTIPAGTESVSGGILAEDVSWTFTTPPPVLTASHPGDQSQPADPLFFIAFDQRVDPAAVLETVQVAAGSRVVPLRLASPEEVAADKTVSRLAENTSEGRWLAFRAVDPLPLDSAITVTVGPGTPSAEGPLTTAEAQSFSFRTYAPLRIEEHGCSWYGDDCRPLAPFYIRFNNPLDLAAFEEVQLTIQPELPGASANAFGNTINIQGATAGQTTYTVVVSAAVRDIFGQQLGRDERLTFRVGRAEPILTGPDQTLVTLDPSAASPELSVYAINYNKLDVKVYAVQPSDWPSFQRYLREYQRTDQEVLVPGRLVRDEVLAVESPADQLTEVRIDLSPHMDGSSGHFVVLVQPHAGLFDKQEYWRAVQVWVQVTRIGLDAFVDHSEMVAWTTALKDGSPLAGVSIEARPGGGRFTTGPDGVARFAIPDGAAYLVARSGADQALLPKSPYAWGDDVWQRRPVEDELRWYVFDDRHIYKPGEELRVKGWLRRIGGQQDGDVSLPGGAVSAVRYTITEPQGNEIGSGRAEVNALGGFDFAFTVPQETNLGGAQIFLDAEGSLSGLRGAQYYHSFQIQEFRRPEFEVAARNESPGPYLAGEQATVAVEAGYYAGGPLPDAEVTWQVAATPGTYSPPNWPDFTFGEWTPWWWGGVRYTESEFYGPMGYEETEYQTFTGRTDAGGEHYLNLDFAIPAEPRPLSVTAEATVMDVNRQAWTGSTSLLVHPAELYVGLRSARYFVERGQPLKIDFIVTDLDGAPVEDRLVVVRAARLEWKVISGAWQEVEADVQECSQASAEEPGTCVFETPLGGTYRVTAEVTDSQGRRNQTRLTRWVSGGQRPPARKVEQEQLTLIPDKETYQPGDTAEILVQPPFSPAEGLLTVTRSGILYTERFEITGETITLRVPVEEAHIPNLNIQVDVVGAAPRSDDAGEPLAGVPPRPAYATGALTLQVPPLTRELALVLTPAEPELEPGAETVIDLTVTDASGQPVEGAEVALVVVDEAVLALTGYTLRDPLDVFYSERTADLAAHYARASIVLADPLALAGEASRQNLAADMVVAQEAEMPAMAAAPMATESMMKSAADEGGAAAQQEAIQLRTDFNPLALFAPVVRTGGDGAASVSLKLPDNLTRYRVMAVAVEGGSRFGTAESNLTARLPLMVRPSAPRFLNFGDRFELPVVIQNQTGAPLEVEVALRAANLALTGSQGYRVTVPARDRVEVRFPAAAQMAGTARFQVAAVTGDYSDAAVGELPVYTPATSEAFATYGVVDEGAVFQPVAAPAGVFPQYGGLEINTSSTALQALTDAVLYLVSYPYECSEQLASRILGVAALRDVLTAFEAEGLPAPAEMEAAVERDIAILQGLQNYDGGFPYWRRGQDSIPFNTIHVAHALQRAELKGFTVPQEMQQNALDYLRLIENYYPSWYSQRVRQTLSAYALYVRDLMGDSDPDKALKLLNDAGLENLDLEAVGWIWQVIQDSPKASAELDAIRRHVNNRAVETAGAANFTTAYDDQTYLLLSSNRRVDAVLLDALITDDPDSDLIPKVVNGLLAHRTAGRWGNTQENVFVLLALDKYFNTYEAQTPDFVARIWLGDTYAGSHEYRGRTTERNETTIPMAYLVEEELGGGQTRDLALSKEGDGRLYYRLGLRYAPTDLELDPLDMGFVVRRVYEAVDDPEDVKQDEDGVWHIRAGARVRVRLTLVADNRRYHVALADPLPAGLEIVNPELAVSGSAPQDPDSPDYRYGWWWWGTWYEHQNLRDERAEAFTSLLWDGVYQYTYLARATTPGRFVVPPAKAEEMYSPEVFGRSASAVVVVE